MYLIELKQIILTIVDCALMLKGNIQSQSQEQQVQFCLITNQFTIKPQFKIKKIENIETCTDFFYTDSRTVKLHVHCT